MSDIDDLPTRDLADDEQPDFPVGTLRIGDAEHSCCYDVAIRRLNIFERGDGSRLQVWDMVAEFSSEADAMLCLAALTSPDTSLPD